MHDKEGVREIFENLRNLVVCAVIIAAGLFEMDHPSGLVRWIDWNIALGWGMVAIGVDFTLLNLVMGLSHLSKLAFPKSSMLLLCLIYVIASLRLVTVMTAFRSS
jgi:hypothetical protein